MALVEVRCRIAKTPETRGSRVVGAGNRIVIPTWFAKEGTQILIYAAEIDGEPCLVIKRLEG